MRGKDAGAVAARRRPSPRPAYGLRLLLMLPNDVWRSPPSVVRATTQASPTSAAMRPYSIKVTPLSSFRNLRIIRFLLKHAVPPLWRLARYYGETQEWPARCEHAGTPSQVTSKGPDVRGSRQC